MNNAVKFILRQGGLHSMVERLEKGQCPTCGRTIDVHTFTSIRHLNEFRRYGLCVRCQIRSDEEAIDRDERPPLDNNDPDDFARRRENI